MDWEDTKQHFCILPYQEIIIKNNLKLFLIIKAKYYVIEPYYEEGSTPYVAVLSRVHLIYLCSVK